MRIVSYRRAFSIATAAWAASSVRISALEVEHADAAILEQQRNHQLRPRIVHDFDISIVAGDVRYQHRLLVQRRVADQAVTDLDARDHDLVAVPNGDLHLQLLRLFVEQQDAEGAVINDAAREIGDPREQLLEVQNRAELARDVRQRLEGSGVLPLVLEQARVLDRDRHVRAELAQNAFVGFRELAGGVAQKIQRTDDASLAAERNDQLRVRSRNGFDVPRVGVDVVDQDRLPLGDRGAHEQPEGPRHLFRVADRIGHAQLLQPRIEQVDRKRLKLRQPRDQLRNLAQQLVEIED